MKKYSFLLALLTIVYHSQAQTGASKKSDADAIKSRTLIVVEEESNPDLTKKLEGESLQFYTEEINNYNRLIKELFPKYWKYNSSIEFKKRSEVNNLIKSKSKDYAYVEWSKFRINFANKMSLEATRKLKSGGVQLFGSDYIETSLDIRLTDNNPLGIPVYGVYLPGPFCSLADLVFGLKQIQLQLNYKSEGKRDGEINNMYKENAKEMPKFTLLVNASASNIAEKDIAKYYKHPIQLVTQDKIEEALINESVDKVVVIFIPRSGGKISPIMVDAATGREMIRSLPDWNAGVGISTAGLDAIKDDMNKGKLRKDDYKIISKQID